MDTTEKYVRMSNNPVIQNDWIPKAGDYISTGDKVLILGTDLFGVTKHTGRSFIFRIMDEPKHVIWEKTPLEEITLTSQEGKILIRRIRNPVWLPRQDQIQEMMKITDGYYFLHSFVSKVFNDGDYLYYRNKTPEQIWLCFYVHKKHDMLWDDEKGWVK